MDQSDLSTTTERKSWKSLTDVGTRIILSLIRDGRLGLTYLALACLWSQITASAFAAESGKIKAAIQKGQQYLLQSKLTGPNGVIASFALIKSGHDKDSKAIQSVLQEVLDKFTTGGYVPTYHHIYEAGVDLMFLEAIDGRMYRPQMTIIVDYVVRHQRSNGAWFYADVTDPDSGDTSFTQYAILGLWAASRVGIEIPTEVLEKAARWHIAKQFADGGFAYHPFSKKKILDPTGETSAISMTCAGSSSLLIIRRMLFGDAEMDSEVRPVDSKRRFGVLEDFVDSKRGAANHVVTLKPSAIDKTLKGSIAWMTSHFTDRSARRELWYTYQLYCVERVGALLDVTTFGKHDWYDEGSDELLMRQMADGSWSDSCTSIASTSLAMLFLSKATASIIKPKTKLNLVGGGLQAGGRGLPDNLDAVQVKDGNVSSRKIVGAVDNLLIELERSSDAKVEDVQAAIVESVQLDRPEELIGQVQRLRKLASDSRLEVRRTAIWALGRSGDLLVTPVLIRALADQDLSVVREASLALCVLTRRVDGCGKPIDPTDDAQMGLKEDSSDDARKTAVDAWREESIRRWTDWYQKNRPYSERDDRAMLKKTNR